MARSYVSDLTSGFVGCAHRNVSSSAPGTRDHVVDHLVGRAPRLVAVERVPLDRRRPVPLGFGEDGVGIRPDHDPPDPLTAEERADLVADRVVPAKGSSALLGRRTLLARATTMAVARFITCQRRGTRTLLPDD
jgi:hypothetical protein